MSDERASDGERVRSQPRHPSGTGVAGFEHERSASLRIAHLTATFPPYPGGAGNTAYRFAKGQAERGHHVEVFTAPAEGEAPDPGEAIVHRVQPVMAIGNAPLIPSIASIDGNFGSFSLAWRDSNGRLLNSIVAVGQIGFSIEGKRTQTPSAAFSADRTLLAVPVTRRTVHMKTKLVLG